VCSLQSAALCRVHSRHCFLRDLPANVSQKFPKNWKIVGTSHNSPEYLTISRERQRKFATQFFWQLRPTSLENLLDPDHREKSPRADHPRLIK
jgi:hypothetical protein